VPEEYLNEIIDCARLAPSANNIQPWEFIVITDKEKLNFIAGLIDYGIFIKDAGAGIVVVSKKTKYYLEDCSAATQNILLAATDLGLGSCWIAGDKKAYAQNVLKYLCVPQDYVLVSIISIGYAAGQPKCPTKRTLKNVLHMEIF
jgi:nitroreductase